MPSSVRVPGPDGPEPWAALHHGRFRIPDFGERSGHVAFITKMAADGVYWVAVLALWSRWSGEEQAFVDMGSTVTFGPKAVGDSGGDFGYVSTIAFDLAAPLGATHWQPEFRWYASQPADLDTADGLPDGARIRFDNFFIPDNGYRVSSEPYLDGDQSYGVWEGPRAASTSVYGDKPPVALGQLVTLEPEFLVPIVDDAVSLASLTYLDPDLKI